jgi:hypothetical protein
MIAQYPASLLCRGKICVAKYTAEEAFAKVVFMHLMTGLPPDKFGWRSFVKASAVPARGATRAAEFFAPSEAQLRLAAHIVAEATFVKRQGSLCGWPYVGYQLQPKPGARKGEFALKPFDLRFTKEESALRLALEVSGSHLSWRNAVATLADVKAAARAADAAAKAAEAAQRETHGDSVDVARRGVVRTRAATVAEAAGVSIAWLHRAWCLGCMGSHKRARAAVLAWSCSREPRLPQLCARLQAVLTDCYTALTPVKCVSPLRDMVCNLA